MVPNCASIKYEQSELNRHISIQSYKRKQYRNALNFVKNEFKADIKTIKLTVLLTLKYGDP